MRELTTYIALRAGRAASVASAAAVVTNNVDAAIPAVAISELFSVGSDVAAILPLFGNVFWLVLLFPHAIHMYTDVYLFNARERHRMELSRVGPCALLLLVVLCLTMPLPGGGP